MKVGLVPISAKPYHRGHQYLVEQASAENDEVIIYASTSDRIRPGEFPVYGIVMREIWEQVIIPNLPKNASVRLGGSPVRHVYEIIGEACDANNFDNVFTIYSDVVDTKKNYPESSRQKYMKTLYEAKKVQFAADVTPSRFIRGSVAPDVRGEYVRNCLGNGDYIGFSKLIPDCINSVMYWDKLTRGV